MIFKCALLLFAMVALAATAQVKRQTIYRTYDDGSYWPGKYEGTAYPYAVASYPHYPASPYAAAAYATAPSAYSYAASPYVASPYGYPYAYYGADDGKYFPGKYGPENQ